MRVGLLDRTELERLVRLLERTGLPAVPPPLSEHEWLARMGTDKKARDGDLRFVLLHGLGAAGVHGDVASEVVREILAPGQGR